MFNLFKSKPASYITDATACPASPEVPAALEVPKDLFKAQDTLKALISGSRAQLEQTQGSASTRMAIDRRSVAALYQSTVAKPDVNKTATLLARMSPAGLIGIHANKQDQPSDELERKFALYAALIEAGLSEQRLTDGVVRDGALLSAAALETSFDDWLIRGRHRPGFDTGELAKIDAVISRTAKGVLNSLDLLQTRFGVLLPCLANVHLWRILEEMPAEKSAKLGWCATGAPADAGDTDEDDDEVEGAANRADMTGGDQGAQHG